MTKRLACLLPLLLIVPDLGAGERKRIAASTPAQQKIIYTNKRLTILPPQASSAERFGTYLGLEGQYATGIQTDRTRLSEYLYREYDEAMIYNEITLKLGFGDINDDRFEIGLTVNKGYALKDSTVTSEFDTGRSLDISYYFVFNSFYEAVDTTNFLPYFRIGIGIGQFDIKEEYQASYNGEESIYSTDYKYGVGVFGQMTRRMELTFGYDIVRRQFQKIEDNGFEKEIVHNTGGLSLGLNYHF
jgi:opacity protein-like surface antigen